jgi:hypothetical protein
LGQTLDDPLFVDVLLNVDFQVSAKLALLKFWKSLQAHQNIAQFARKEIT